MKKELRLKKVWACCVMLLMTKFLFAQPGGYAWDRFGMGNVVMTNNSPVNGIVSNTTQATSTTNYYLVQWDNYANKWSNTSTPYNQVFTLTWGGGSFNGPNGAFATAPTSGRHYTLQIHGLSYSTRQGVIMETNNAPQSFHPTASTAVSNPGVVCSGAAVTINVTLAGAKSPQERVFVRYSSTSNFATSKVVEATGTGSTWSTASATIPGADNTSGTIFYYAYTTTVAATDASDHDLITLRLGNNGGSNYSYSIAPTPGFVNLQFPGSVTICQGSDFNAFGQIFVSGRTEAPGAGSGIVAEVGYSSTNTNPNTWTNWIAAPYFGQGGLGNNNDEYRGTFGAALAPGTYYYAFRYQINGCTFFYGGFNAGGGGTWNGTSNNSGVLTITPSTTYYQDADGDGFGNPSVAQTTCSAPVGFVTNNSDCNDNQLRYADADGDGFGSTTLVACGGVVNNTDCNDNQLRYADNDGDGFGSTTFVACGGVLNNTDCDDNQLRYADTDGDGFGSTTLVACGGVVNNTDCNDNQLRYADTDGDGFGSTTFVACGGVLNNTDCDDNQLRYADADGDGFGSTTFVACGGVLNNTDCNDALLTYVDADGDGFGTSTPAPCGATNTTDCNDANPAVFVNGTFYVDADGDGFGASTAAPSTVCVANVSIAPSGFSVNNGDCNDANASIRPGAVDVCYDGIDNDCNGNIDNLGLPGGCTPIVSTFPTATCGTTVAFGGIVYSSLVSGAQGYRYRVTEVNPADDSEIPGTQVTVDMVLRNLYLHNLSNYKYNAKYKVEIAVRINNVWQPNFSAPCFLFTPVAVSTMLSCGTQITGINTQVFSSLVPRSTGYRYRIQRLDNALQPVGLPQEITSGLRNFTFAAVTDFRYDANYNVSCAVRNTDGTFLPYGPSCTIQAPKHPTTQMRGTQCNDYAVVSFSERLFADAVQSAAQYRFRLFNEAQEYDFAIDRPLNSFRLSDFIGLISGENYSVQVAVRMPNQLDFGPYSKTCTLTVPSIARSLEETTTATLGLDAQVYPNPFAEQFYFKVATSSQASFTIQVYDMMGRAIETRTVNADAIESTEVGANYPAGVYQVILTQGANMKTLRVVKR